MKFLAQLLVSVLALGAGSCTQYIGPIHLPIIGENGVPIEPQEVRAARASHMAAHAAARIAAHANPDRSEYEKPDQHNNYEIIKEQLPPPAELTGPGPIIQAPPPPLPQHDHAPLIPWPGPYAQVTPDGTPLDTPEVQAAKQQHLLDYWETARRNSLPQNIFNNGLQFGGYEGYGGYPQPAYLGAHGHSRKRRGAVYPHAYPTSQAYPVLGPDGQPLETPEVQEAKSRHFEQLQREAARNALGKKHYFPHFHTAYHAPAPVPPTAISAQPSFSHHAFINHPDFQQVLAAHPLFSGQGNFYSQPSNDIGAYPPTAPAYPPTAPAYPPTSPAAFGNIGYQGSYHYPVIVGGVPTETPEVQQARAFHLAAHAKAKRGGH